MDRPRQREKKLRREENLGERARWDFLSPGGIFLCDAGFFRLKARWDFFVARWDFLRPGGICLGQVGFFEEKDRWDFFDARWDFFRRKTGGILGHNSLANCCLRVFSKCLALCYCRCLFWTAGLVFNMQINCKNCGAS